MPAIKTLTLDSLVEWHMLQVITSQIDSENRTVIKDWLEENCVGKFYLDYRNNFNIDKNRLSVNSGAYRSSIWFELEGDKALFILTWLK